MNLTTEQQVQILLAQNTDKLLALIQVGFFDMKRGSITAHFDPMGKIQRFDKHIVFDVVNTEI